MIKNADVAFLLSESLTFPSMGLSFSGLLKQSPNAATHRNMGFAVSAGRSFARDLDHCTKLVFLGCLGKQPSPKKSRPISYGSNSLFPLSVSMACSCHQVSHRN